MLLVCGGARLEVNQHVTYSIAMKLCNTMRVCIPAMHVDLLVNSYHIVILLNTDAVH